MEISHLLHENQVSLSPKNKQNQKADTKQRVTIIRTENPFISGLYNNGYKVDKIENQDKYLVQELVYASDAHYYGKQFFSEETDLKYAWQQSRFIHEIECAIMEELLSEEE